MTSPAITYHLRQKARCHKWLTQRSSSHSDLTSGTFGFNHTSVMSIYLGELSSSWELYLSDSKSSHVLRQENKCDESHSPKSWRKRSGRATIRAQARQEIPALCIKTGAQGGPKILNRENLWCTRKSRVKHRLIWERTKQLHRTRERTRNLR